jgi:uncharacterized protein YjbJ (UPF0337 family)
MYIFNSKENCKELKDKFKQQFTCVTDEDLECNNGMKKEMLEKIQQKLGKSNEELHEIILKLG